jgi:streptogramin lyase
MGITTGPDNALWFTEYNGRKVGRISAAPFFSEYSLPTGYNNPTSMVSSAGSMWYLNTTSSSQPFLSKITTSGTTTNYSPIPAGDTGGDFVSHNLTVDTSGNVWFSGCGYSSSGSTNMFIGYMNPSTNAMTTFQYASTLCNNPNWIVGAPAVDASGNIWVYLHTGGYAGHSIVQQFSPSGVSLSSWAPTSGNQDWTSVTAGPSNSLWLTDDHNNQIDQLSLSPTTDQVTGMNAYTPLGTLSSLVSITTGPDGNLWFGESGSIAKMTPSGTFTDYTLPTGAQPSGITTGPDNALWFTDYYGGADTVGRVTTSGGITEYPIPTSGAYPMGITAGSDGALWFTEYNSGKIGRIGY